MSNKFLIVDGWLQRIGLRHPFRSATTSESDDINQLCDPFCWIGDLISSPDGHIIWGRPGEGKSAYRHILEQTVKANVESDKWHTVSLCKRELAAIAPGVAVAQRLDDTRFAELLVDFSLSRLGLQQDAGQSTKFGPSASNRRQMHGRSTQHETLETVLDRLRDLLGNLGYTGCMILVDEIDDTRGAKGNPYVERELLRPLFSESFEKPFWRWRAFLPEALRPHLTGEYAISTKVQQWSIEWRTEHLQQMIADRMLHYSGQKYETIGDLCDEELGPVVDAELIALSHNNPRNAIMLASMLFREHCQRSPIPRVIERVSWDKVRDEWKRRSAPTVDDQFRHEDVDSLAVQQAAAESKQAVSATPMPAELRLDETGATWVGAQEITKKLNKRRYEILKLLYDKHGKVVTKDELIDVGWPPPEYMDPADVSHDDMIRQQINHIRDILSSEIDYIESVSGRGYRLNANGIALRRPKSPAP